MDMIDDAVSEQDDPYDTFIDVGKLDLLEMLNKQTPDSEVYETVPDDFITDDQPSTPVLPEARIKQLKVQ